MKIVSPKIEVENYDGLKIMKNIEKACRNCYRSENIINEESYKHLIENCLNRGHESVLEHEKITVRMDCDIGVYKDLSRHRFGSFSIESTRYCNYSREKFDNNIKFIKPVFYKDNWSLVEQEEEDIKSVLWYKAMSDIESYYMQMAAAGAKPDELRMILPHSTAASVYMTANIREWKHILSLRCSKAAHPAIRQLLIPLLLKFKKDMPEIFDRVEYDTTFPVDKYAELTIIS